MQENILEIDRGENGTELGAGSRPLTAPGNTQKQCLQQKGTGWFSHSQDGFNVGRNYKLELN